MFSLHNFTVFLYGKNAPLKFVVQQNKIKLLKFLFFTGAGLVQHFQGQYKLRLISLQSIFYLFILKKIIMIYQP